MSVSTKKIERSKARSVYGIFLGVLSVALGAAFIVQVWRIFSIGERAFTAARVAKYFRQIAPIAFAWVEAVIGGVILNAMFPSEEKLTPYVDENVTLARLTRRCETEKRQPLIKRRKAAWVACFWIGGALIVAAGIFFFGPLIPIADEGFFATHEEATRLVLALPCVIAALCVWSGVEAYDSKSKKREIAIVKQEIVENAKKGVKVTPSQTEEVKTGLALKLDRVKKFCSGKWFIFGLKTTLFVVAVVFIVTGILGGGMGDVLLKAINICTQCIGLG